MCEPTTLLAASLALSAATTGLTVAEQHSQAKSQAAYQESLTKASNTQAENSIAALRIQQAQSRESTARETEKARLASQRAKASAEVAAGEAGVSGNSVDALLQEYSTNLDQFKEATIRQRSLEDASYADQVAAIRSGASYQALQINAPIAQPQYGAAALKLGADALGAYRSYNPSAFKKG